MRHKAREICILLYLERTLERGCYLEYGIHGEELGLINSSSSSSSSSSYYYYYYYYYYRERKGCGVNSIRILVDKA